MIFTLEFIYLLSRALTWNALFAWVKAAVGGPLACDFNAESVTYWVPEDWPTLLFIALLLPELIVLAAMRTKSGGGAPLVVMLLE